VATCINSLVDVYAMNACVEAGTHLAIVCEMSQSRTVSNKTFTHISKQ